MKKETITSGKNLTIWIINFSILGLVLTSLFPLVSVTENDAVKEDLYFDYKMMKNSDNIEIYSLVSDVDLINLVFWVILILGLISFFCITFLTFITRWYLSLMTIIITAILIFSIFLIIFQFNFIAAVVNNDFISLPSIFYTFKYIHIILIFSIILLICSSLYILIIVSDLVKQLVNLKSKKELKKKKSEKPEETPLTPLFDKKTPPAIGSIKTKVEMEKWFKQENQDSDKKTEQNLSTQEKETLEPIEPPTKEKIEIKDEKPTLDDKIRSGPFSTEKREVKPKDSDEPKAAQSFEKALSSAIEKKQSELDKNESITPKSEEIIEDSEALFKEERTQPKQIEDFKEEEKLSLNEKDISSTDIIVKCPQCKQIFTTNKEGDTTKIKCPKCGKEGITQ